jgi:integrase
MASKDNRPKKRGYVGLVPPDCMVSPDSRFGDSEWDFSSFIHVKNVPPCRTKLNFDIPLPDGTQLTDPCNELLYISTKECYYAQLQAQPNCRQPNVRTLISELANLRIFICWTVNNKHSIYSQLCAHHVEVYFVSFLRGHSEDENEGVKARSEERVVTILRVVQRLWEFRDQMSDSLTFNPFGGRAPCTVFGVDISHRGQNRTPVIPDEVMIPLGNAALDYVYIYSKDILEARARVEALRRELDERARYDYSHGVRDTPTFRATTIGNYLRSALRDVPLTIRADTGEPWRPPFSSVFHLYREEDLLFTACYIVTAWLTGMRDSEIADMRAGCLRCELSDDGVIERIKIRSTVYKGVRDRRGRPETWVTIEPVAEAVDVLTRVTEHLRARTGGKVTELFVRGERKLSVSVIAGDRIRQMLRSFAEHIDLPLVNGKMWNLCSRQFRRTLAWWIGRKPFGVIAGMSQYKHVESATFEGYTARDAEFVSNLEEERLLANIDVLEELRQDALEGRVAGPKAPEIIETFRGIAGDRRADDERYMLMHLSRTLYVGLYVTCFYDPIYARCQEHIPVEERKAPIMTHCHLDQCPNACMSKRHLTPYLDQLNEVGTLLKTSKLPVPQRVALEQELVRITRIVRPLAGIPEDN